MEADQDETQGLQRIVAEPTTFVLQDDRDPEDGMTDTEAADAFIAAINYDGDQARAREEALEELFAFAQEGWDYAGDYFRTRWRAVEELARLRKVLTPGRETNGN